MSILHDLDRKRSYSDWDRSEKASLRVRLLVVAIGVAASWILLLALAPAFYDLLSWRLPI